MKGHCIVQTRLLELIYIQAILARSSVLILTELFCTDTNIQPTASEAFVTSTVTVSYSSGILYRWKELEPLLWTEKKEKSDIILVGKVE